MTQLYIDATTEQFFVDGQEAILTPMEKMVIAVLARRKHVGWTTSELIAKRIDASPDAIKTHISRIRTKLGEDVIQTSRERGYRWNFDPVPCPTCGRTL